MKILKQIENGPTTIEISPQESAIIFKEDGTPEALMSGPAQSEDEEANASTWMCFVALHAALDEEFRAMVEAKIANKAKG